jgi:hypothetical protein
MKGGWELYWYHFVHVVPPGDIDALLRTALQRGGLVKNGEHEAVSTEKLGLVYSTNS